MALQHIWVPNGVGLAQQGVGAPLVQGYPVPDAMLAHHGIDPVASVGVGRAECSKSCFYRRNIPLDRRLPHHGLPPWGDMLRTLDRAADGLGAPIAGRANGLRRRPQFAAPQRLLPLKETLEPPLAVTPWSSLTGIGHGDTRQDPDKKVTVIWLELLGDHRLPTFGADRIWNRSRFASHRSGQRVAPILRTPDQLVGRWDVRRCHW